MGLAVTCHPHPLMHTQSYSDIQMCTDIGEPSMSRLRRSAMSLSSFCNREMIFNVSLGEETCSLDP